MGEPGTFIYDVLTPYSVSQGYGTTLCVSTGQLGDSGGTAWRTQSRPGASETGGLHAEEEEVAYEGVAQGRHSSLLSGRILRAQRST